MDPISAIILVGIFVTVVGKTAGSGLTDAIAQAKGHTPPSLEKWRARQQTRHGKGGHPAREPGPWRRRWDNAVEHSTAKAAQKHQARMEHLRDSGRDAVDRHKARLRKRAERRDKIGATVAGWGGASWEAAQRGASAARSAYVERRDERQAWAENTRRDAETPGEPDGGEGQEAEVLPFRQPDQQHDTDPAPEAAEPATADRGQPDQAPTPADTELADHTDNATATDGGTDMPAPTSSPQAPATTEITDLDTAITYTGETVKYADDVAARLSEIVSLLTSAVEGLDSEAAQYEQGKASLEGEGFGAKITGPFDTAMEALNTAAAAVRATTDQVSQASEQVTAAAGEMRTANKALAEQLAVAEQIGAARQDAGVSHRTDFYAPA